MLKADGGTLAGFEMTLKSQLFWGIAVGLGFILAFSALLGFSYRGLDSFISGELISDMALARHFEGIVSNWIRLSETLEEKLGSPNPDFPLVPEGLFISFEKALTDLEVLTKNQPKEAAAFREIADYAASYTLQLKDYERALRRKIQLVIREASKLETATKALSSHVEELLNGFKNMMEAFSKALRNPDFQPSVGTTSSLMLQVARIEKDLIVAQSDIAIYLTTKMESSPKNHATDRSELSDRIQRRLQAVIALLDKSLEESQGAVSTRVLSSIRNQVKSFKQSFSELQEAVEKPDSEVLEIKDQLEVMKKSIKILLRNGVFLADTEAKNLWNRITERSQALLFKNWRYFSISFLFLGFGMIIGLLALGFYPKRIAGPLQALNDRIRAFRLGTPLRSNLLHGTQEIMALGESFSSMAERLNAQVVVNSHYINAISQIGQVYFDLGNSTFQENPQLRGLEGAINQILHELMEGIEGIDIAKVMLLKNSEKGEKPERFFHQIGETKFSEDFNKVPEFEEYCQSVGLTGDGQYREGQEINVPFDEGLSGYFFTNDPSPKAEGEVLDSWARNYEIKPIQDIVTLVSRKFERGLFGCMHVTLLKKELTTTPTEIEDQKVEYLGLLLIYFRDKKIKLSHQDLLFSKILARQISIVIESAELLKIREKQKKTEYQLELAKQIQETLLPKTVPKVSTLKISHLNKPAYEVGGDYYEFFDFGDKKLRIIIADASGKNIPAAMIMMVLKTTLATMDLKTLSTSEVLKKANQTILKKISLEDRFITAMYVTIDSEKNEIELSCAGHNPALMVSGKGFELSISELSAQGVPLGIMEMEYNSVKYKFSPGDFLLLYTDGVTESRNYEGKEFGLSRLKKFLSRPLGNNPLSDLEKEIERFIDGADQHDDITAVGVEYQKKK